MKRILQYPSPESSLLEALTPPISESWNEQFGYAYLKSRERPVRTDLRGLYPTETVLLRGIEYPDGSAFLAADVQLAGKEELSTSEKFVVLNSLRGLVLSTPVGGFPDVRAARDALIAGEALEDDDMAIDFGYADATRNGLPFGLLVKWSEACTANEPSALTLSYDRVIGPVHLLAHLNTIAAGASNPLHPLDDTTACSLDRFISRTCIPRDGRLANIEMSFPLSYAMPETMPLTIKLG